MSPETTNKTIKFNHFNNNIKMEKKHKIEDIATVVCMVILVATLIACTIIALVQMRFVYALINAIMCVYALCVTGSLLTEKD